LLRIQITVARGGTSGPSITSWMPASSHHTRLLVNGILAQ
jgi:hypothetical protein